MKLELHYQKQMCKPGYKYCGVIGLYLSAGRILSKVNLDLPSAQDQSYRAETSTHGKGRLPQS